MGGTGAKVDFCQEKMRKNVTSYLPDFFMREKQLMKAPSIPVCE